MLENAVRIVDSYECLPGYTLEYFLVKTHNVDYFYT